MLHDLRLGVELFAWLSEMDREIARWVAIRGCRYCGGPLHQGNYRRKPRGAKMAEDGRGIRTSGLAVLRSRGLSAPDIAAVAEVSRATGVRGGGGTGGERAGTGAWGGFGRQGDRGAGADAETMGCVVDRAVPAESHVARDTAAVGTQS